MTKFYLPKPEKKNFRPNLKLPDLVKCCQWCQQYPPSTPKPNKLFYSGQLTQIKNHFKPGVICVVNKYELIMARILLLNFLNVNVNFECQWSEYSLFFPSAVILLWPMSIFGHEYPLLVNLNLSWLVASSCMSMPVVSLQILSLLGTRSKTSFCVYFPKEQPKVKKREYSHSKI